MEFIIYLIAVFIKLSIYLGIILLILAYLPLMERKVLAYIQQRVGPNRVGPWGLLQPIADGIKLFFKEEIIPANADKLLFIISPILAVGSALLVFAVIPFSLKNITIPFTHIALPIGFITDLNIALIYILAISSFSVYAVTLGGYSSGSKYSLLGGLRSAAQLLSYEVPAALCLVAVAISAQSMSLVSIVSKQGSLYNLYWQPLGFIVFLICVFAETNRLPFDLPEAETELVGGYNTEYSSMKFAMFFMGEYAHILAGCCIITCLFLGGWYPIINIFPFTLIPGIIWFAAKVFILVFLFMWVRGTIPRFRYDQLMKFSWKILFPLSLLNLFITAIISLYR